MQEPTESMAEPTEIVPQRREGAGDRLNFGRQQATAARIKDRNRFIVAFHVRALPAAGRAARGLFGMASRVPALVVRKLRL